MLIGAIVGALIGLVLAAAVTRLQSALPRPQAPAQPQPPARGHGWPPTDYQLAGTFEQAAAVVDQNMPVGELRAAWLDYHDGLGNIVVTVPGQRQLSAGFQPPAPGWRYGDPR